MAKLKLTAVCIDCGNRKAAQEFGRYRNGRKRSRRCHECVVRNHVEDSFARATPEPPRKHLIGYIDAATKSAYCAVCGPTEIVLVASKSGTEAWKCAIAQRKLSSHFRHLVGDCCEICGSTEKLCADHDHATGLFRGTLCHFCNIGIGFLKDSPTLVMIAARYLAKPRAALSGFFVPAICPL